MWMLDETLSADRMNQITAMTKLATTGTLEAISLIRQAKTEADEFQLSLDRAYKVRHASDSDRPVVAIETKSEGDVDGQWKKLDDNSKLKGLWDKAYGAGPEGEGTKTSQILKRAQAADDQARADARYAMTSGHGGASILTDETEIKTEIEITAAVKESTANLARAKAAQFTLESNYNAAYTAETIKTQKNIVAINADAQDQIKDYRSKEAATAAEAVDKESQ